MGSTLGVPRECSGHAVVVFWTCSGRGLPTYSWHASGLIAEEAQKWGFTPPQFVSDMQQKYQNQ